MYFSFTVEKGMRTGELQEVDWSALRVDSIAERNRKIGMIVPLSLDSKVIKILYLQYVTLTLEQWMNQRCNDLKKARVGLW